jgi:hypothetical protein
MSSSPSGAAAIGSKHDELRLLINSRNPIITVETAEEERLAHLLTAIAVELCVPMYAWSVTAGLARIAGEPIYGTAQPEQALTNIAQIRGDAIFLLKDFARYCNNDKICRMLRDLADAFRSVRRSIVISALSLNLPPEIVSESAPIGLRVSGTWPDTLRSKSAIAISGQGYVLPSVRLVPSKLKSPEGHAPCAGWNCWRTDAEALFFGLPLGVHHGDGTIFGESFLDLPAITDAYPLHVCQVNELACSGLNGSSVHRRDAIGVLVPIV